MKRPVDTAGEICQHCIEKYPRHRTIEDMGLDELIATQERGTVPGQAYKEKKEIPRGLLRGDGRLCP